MAQGQLIAARLLCHIVQDPPAHSGAQAAGISFFPILENDPAQLGAPDMVRHIQPPAKLLNLGVVGGFAVKLGIRRQGGHLEPAGIKFPQGRQGAEKHQAVLAAGNAYGNPVPLPDHMIFFHGRPHRA